MERTFYFHHGWRFRLANAFPLADALAATRDENGRTFESPAYIEQGWQRVALPHTFMQALRLPCAIWKFVVQATS